MRLVMMRRVTIYHCQNYETQAQLVMELLQSYSDYLSHSLIWASFVNGIHPSDENTVVNPAGFSVEAIFGDFYRNKFGNNSPHMIWVANTTRVSIDRV